MAQHHRPGVIPAGRPALTSVLLGRLVDYAGMFPPAALPLAEALKEYERLRSGPAEWMVAPFLVPARAVPDLGALVDSLSVPLELGAIVSRDGLCDELELLRKRPPSIRLAQLELPLPDQASVGETAALLRRQRSWDAEIVIYLELAGSAPLNDQVEDLSSWVEALSGVAEVRAKIRTGGRTTASIPAQADLAAFLVGCSRAGHSFKATAGLHGPYRHFDPATGVHQHGFLNLLAASALAAAGAPAGVIARLLEAPDDDALAAGWADARPDVAAATTRQFLRSVGSCSPAEMIEHLAAAGILAPDGTQSRDRLW